MAEFTVNPLLAYSQHSVVPEHPAGPFPCSIVWDMRSPTSNAQAVGPQQRPLSYAELMQPATNPPLSYLNITCGIFPNDWPIRVQRADGGGITIGDVLHAVHTMLTRRVSHTEWHALSAREQERITAVFNARWTQASDAGACRQNGVLRMDCLLQHTLFGGLSISPRAQNSCLLSLRRVR